MLPTWTWWGCQPRGNLEGYLQYPSPERKLAWARLWFKGKQPPNWKCCFLSECRQLEHRDVPGQETWHRSWGQTRMTLVELGQWHTHTPCLLLCSCPLLWPSQPQIPALGAPHHTRGPSQGSPPISSSLLPHTGQPAPPGCPGREAAALTPALQLPGI